MIHQQNWPFVELHLPVRTCDSLWSWDVVQVTPTVNREYTTRRVRQLGALLEDLLSEEVEPATVMESQIPRKGFHWLGSGV